ncbi:hypothetical protein AAG570_013352 [Ranatra chinensis]|uniref:Exonuclease domain-containing protein n=1 Tax=Ranatra chinensis TaxID=642074 RepID=A0ABD0YUG1_9HEMI
MVLENYPIPLKGELSQKYADYVMTCDSYVEVSAQSPMWGLDCEMCMTPAGSELTRVTVVNEQHEVVYNSLVKPYNPITNYLTKFSGITKKMLEDVNTRLEDVQRDLRAIIPPDCILVGQSLNMDLHALKMIHPYVIDTSIVFNISGERSRKSKLRVLVLEFLSETIQGSDKGHDSKEDAISALKLVQKKLQHSTYYICRYRF